MSKPLTTEQNLALQEVRNAMCERLRTFSFTDEMLEDKSLFQLLNLLQLLIGHRNYLGMFSQTLVILREIFGDDAIWDRPVKQPEPEPSQEQKALVM